MRLAPGFIDTEMTQAMTDSAKEAGLAQVPLGRMGTPEDIANTVAFLAVRQSLLYYRTG